jgi:HEAT repeats
MTKTLTIELPDNLKERLGLPANSADAFLEVVILQTLQTLANSIQRLHDPHPAIRVKAAQTLGILGTATVIPALVQVLHDSDLNVRQAAIQALQQIGTESALAALVRGLPSETSAHPQAFDPLSSLIGTLSLGTTDLAENHDRYLTADLERELNPGEWPIRPCY